MLLPRLLVQRQAYRALDDSQKELYHKALNEWFTELTCIRGKRIRAFSRELGILYEFGDKDDR